jgi:hypothetical protein
MIRAENIDLSDFSFVDFMDYRREFIATEGGWLCFVPVKMDTKPKSYETTCYNHFRPNALIVQRGLLRKQWRGSYYNRKSIIATRVGTCWIRLRALLLFP